MILGAIGLLCIFYPEDIISLRSWRYESATPTEEYVGLVVGSGIICAGFGLALLIMAFFI